LSAAARHPTESGAAGTPPPRTARVACVQYGDYLDAWERLNNGGPESYYAQRDTITSFERFVDGREHLVVSLNAPRYRVQTAARLAVGIGSPPAWTRRPARLAEHCRAARVIRALEAFAPTHVLNRAVDIVGCRVLAWTTRRALPTAVIIATWFDPAQAVARRFCRLADHPSVTCVGNHNRVATASLVACGLRPDKALAWDFPVTISPRKHATKRLPEPAAAAVVFAGDLTVAKGVLDFVAAGTALQHAGMPLRFVVLGSGPLHAALASHPGRRAGWLELTGPVSHAEAVRRIRLSTVVVVPSHPTRHEALPMVIYEALATRTPLVVSDHPVFRSYFSDGDAVLFFQAGAPLSLVDTLRRLLSDRLGYARMSEQTAAVWESIQCATTFDDLLQRVARAWFSA